MRYKYKKINKNIRKKNKIEKCLINMYFHNLVKRKSRNMVESSAIIGENEALF